MIKTIGISGPTSSGKSFIAKRLNQIINIPSSVFNQDHYYYLEADQPKDENGAANFDTPESLDLDLFKQHFFDLQAGRDVEKERYNYNKPLNGLSPFVEFKSAPLIIVEGIFIFHDPELFNSYDLTIFIDIDPKIQLERRLKRDWIERGYDKDDVMYKFENHIHQSFKKYLLPFKDKTDFYIDNSSIQINEIEEYLKEIANKIEGK